MYKLNAKYSIWKHFGHLNILLRLSKNIIHIYFGELRDKRIDKKVLPWISQYLPLDESQPYRIYAIDSNSYLISTVEMLIAKLQTQKAIYAWMVHSTWPTFDVSI